MKTFTPKWRPGKGQPQPRGQIGPAPRSPWPAGLLMGVWLVAVMGGGEAAAQLAITEVLNLGATNCSARPASLDYGPDFWELTNFGTNTINLQGFQWRDRDKTWPQVKVTEVFNGLSIGPGESVIFVRGGNALVGDELAFREWWWGDPLAYPELQVRFYPKDMGLDETQDAVMLADPQTNLVDEVAWDRRNLEPTPRGVTLIYDPLTGESDKLSQEGVAGAFRAACPEDIGSPGSAQGPFPLRILEAPTDQAARAGSWLTLRARAIGLPRPRYQWYHNGKPIPGANSPEYAMVPVLPSQAGEYVVEITNGLERLTTKAATLSVDASFYAPQIICPAPESCVPSGDPCPPYDLAVTPGQQARFEVFTWGYPVPSYQWYSNGVPIAGATQPTLVIGHADYASAGVYCVQVANELGATNACATLSLEDKPQLRITEVMNVACGGADRDWWELTNLGSQPVNLCGYRWDDICLPAIGGGPTVSQAVIIQPGESVIFAERLSREEFINWWGASNLPPNLQVITHFANGLGDTGDCVTLWNASATDALDQLDGVDFSTGSPGISRWYGKLVCANGDPKPEHGVFSVAGECGAFQAAQSCDVGSPGWTQWTPPRLLSVKREAAGLAFVWKAPPGSTSLLEYRSDPNDTNWTILETNVAPGAIRTATDTTCGAHAPRVYRIVTLPNCHYCCGEETFAPYLPLASETLLWPSRPVLTHIERNSSGAVLTWTTEPGAAYVLQCRAEAARGPWTSLLTNVAQGVSITVTDATLRSDSQRFYRVIATDPSL